MGNAPLNHQRGGYVMIAKRFLRSFVLALLLYPITAGSAFCSTATDDCLMDWFEANYSTFIRPAGATSAYLGPYYFRFYAQTQSYLATNVDNGHVYYMGPATNNSILDLGLASNWLSSTTCMSGSGDEVRQYLDTLFGLSGSSLTEDINEQMAIIMSSLSDSNSTTCPAVSTIPDLESIDLDAMPTTLQATVNFGNGCKPQGMDDLFAGGMQLTVSNFSLNPQTYAASGNLLIDFNNITQNGVPASDGTVNGSFSLTGLMSESMNATLSLNVSNFLLPNTGSRLNGFMGMSMQGSNISLDVDVQDSNSIDVDMLLHITTTENGFVLNTASTGTLNRYSVRINSVTFDETRCASYPISGSVSFTSPQNESWTATFNGRCDGSYDFN